MSTIPKRGAAFGAAMPFLSVLHQHDPIAVQPPRLGDGSICHILRRAVGREAFLFNEEGGDDAGGGGGDDPPPSPGAGNSPPAGSGSKTYTAEELQRELDARAAKIRQDERKKFGDYDKIKEQAAKVLDLEKQLQEFKDEQETKGKSAEEKARIDAQRAQRQIEREREQAASELKQEKDGRLKAEGELKQLRLSIVLGNALDQAKVLPAAKEKAIKAMLDDITYEMTDEGALSSIMYGGVLQKTPTEAAVAFLRDNDFYASGGTPKGGGSKRPSASGTPGGRPLHELSTEELLALHSQRENARGSAGAR